MEAGNKNGDGGGSDDELRVRAVKILRRVLFGILVIILIGSIGLIGWATVRAQGATERAAEVLPDNGVQREDGRLVLVGRL